MSIPSSGGFGMDRGSIAQGEAGTFVRTPRNSGSRWFFGGRQVCGRTFSGREIGSADGDLRVGVSGLWTGRLPQWVFWPNTDRTSRAMKQMHTRISTRTQVVRTLAHVLVIT